MEEIAQVVMHIVRDGALYTINGLLIIIYALLAQWALVLAVLCALGILIFDRLAALSSKLSARGEAPASNHAVRVTLITLVLWIVVALSVPMPVPALGLGIWLTTLLAGWFIPARRVDVLWRGKMSLLMYALANIGLLLFTQLTSNLSSSEWAQLLGSTSSAESAIAQSKGLVQTVATIAIWYLMPLGAIGWQIKEFAFNRGSIVAPGKTTAEIYHAIRTRGGRVE